MKHFRFTSIVLLVMATLFSSCEKSDVEIFNGTYSYKTSGKVALLPSDYVNASDEEKAYLETMGMTPSPQWIALQPEQGQMHIRSVSEDDNTVIITFNDLFGNACMANAIIDGDNISISDAQQKTIAVTDGSEKLGGGFVVYTGEGHIYDDVIVLTLTYNGVVSISGVNMSIVESYVECIATLN